MTLEPVVVEFDGKKYPVFHCIGNGMTECKNCKRTKGFGINWTVFTYQITEDGEPLCYDCLKEYCRLKNKENV